MADQNAFHISDNSTVLTPEAPGMASLVQALRQRASILATQSGSDPIHIKPGEPQWLLCESSGTGGTPKVIRRPPASWIRSFSVNHAEFELDAGDTYAVLGHLGHSLSLYATLEALHLGADLIHLSGLRPRMQAAEIARASVLYTTPTQLRLLCAGLAATGLSPHRKLRRIFCGGGRLDPELAGVLPQHFPNAKLHVFFGASETSFISISDANTPPGSVGRAYPGVTLDLRPLPGQGKAIGEIWVSSPYLFDRYESGTSKDTQWDGSALSIGEMGYLDPDGHLFLIGRKSRMVTVSDQNVFPEEVERIVAQDPDVSACAVLPVKDPKRGHQIVCMIEGHNSPALDMRLRTACRDALGDASVPKHILHLDTLPLLPAGKPDLQALHALLEGKL
ncbi:MAG TPA: hypothetical protein DEO85_06620 [Maritimibacter sp.]|nr:hypothetical protein [Maritimibacter sp.]